MIQGSFKQVCFHSIFITSLILFKNIFVSSTCVQNAAQVFDSFPDIKSLVTGDINGDGYEDLVATSPILNTIYWFKNNNGAFTTNIVGNNTLPYSVCTGDFNQDGKIDIAFSFGYAPVFIYWYENVLGDGTLWYEKYVAQMGSPFYKIICGDVDNDGDDDIVSYDYFGSSIYFLDNINGDGSSFIENQIGNDIEVSSVAFDNINNNGQLGVLVQSYNNGLSLYTLSAQKWISTIIFPGSSYHGVSDVKSGDINGDGLIDIVIASHLDQKLVWFQNTNSGYQSQLIDSGNSFAYLYLYDFNGDGFLDLIASTNTGLILYTNTDGSGLNWTKIRVGLPTQSFVVDDFNNNGFGDIGSLGFYSLTVLQMNYSTLCTSLDFPIL